MKRCILPIDSAYEAARKQAASPNFSVRNNPLADTTPEENRKEQYINQNMDRLYRDAARRRDVNNGVVYSGIMDMRYGE